MMRPDVFSFPASLRTLFSVFIRGQSRVRISIARKERAEGSSRVATHTILENISCVQQADYTVSQLSHQSKWSMKNILK